MNIGSEGITKLCAVALVCAFYAAFAGAEKSCSFSSSLVRAGGSVAIFGGAMALLSPAVEYVWASVNITSQASALSSYAVVLFKALGTAWLTYIVSGLCRDGGENALAGNVEMLGRVQILLLSLPLLDDVLSLAKELVP